MDSLETILADALYALWAQQTEAGIAEAVKAAQAENKAIGSRIDFYLGHLAYCIDMFDLDPTLIKSNPNDQKLLDYGSLTPSLS